MMERELAPYLADPTAMPAGAAGKCGAIVAEFLLDGRGRSVISRLERHAPLIAQQELYFDEAMPEMPCLYILSSGGPNVEGDRYSQHFTVRRDACAHVTTGAATKLAEMRHNHSRMIQSFSLEDGAYMEYLPEPTIPCRHARYISHTTLRIAATATMLYSEIYTCGRRHMIRAERFSYDMLSLSLCVERPDGTPLFDEKQLVRPALLWPDCAAAMNGYDNFATVVMVAPEHHWRAVFGRCEVGIDRGRGVARGISVLPNNCGVLLRILTRDTTTAKRAVREFASEVRREVKGRPLNDDFPWR